VAPAAAAASGPPVKTEPQGKADMTVKLAQAAFFGPIPQSTRVAARLPWSTDAHL